MINHKSKLYNHTQTRPLQDLWHHHHATTAGIEHPGRCGEECQNAAQGHWTKSQFQPFLSMHKNQPKPPFLTPGDWVLLIQEKKTRPKQVKKGKYLDIRQWRWYQTAYYRGTHLLCSAFSLSLHQQGASRIEHTLEAKTEDDKQTCVTWFHTPVLLLSSSPSLSSSCHLAIRASSLPLNHVGPDY